MYHPADYLREIMQAIASSSRVLYEEEEQYVTRSIKRSTGKDGRQPESTQCVGNGVHHKKCPLDHRRASCS